MTGKVLVVDDDQSIRQSIELFLVRAGLDARAAHDGFHALEIMKGWNPDLCIVDVKMPGMTGLELLDTLKAAHPSLPVIIITAYDEMEYTIEAIRRGAYDFLEKPIDIDRLKVVVGSALEQQQLSRRTNAMQAAPETGNGGITIIGSTPPMKQIFKHIGQVSNSRITVLLQGDSGTGKELIARVVHESGVTRGLPFVAVNCTVLAEGLIESELFGHVKGSFTSADREKKGKFELAGDGTIFLDEIADVSPAFQAAAARAAGARVRTGGRGAQPAALARVIAATNKDLWRLVRDGAFREDLYYRLSVFRIDVPPCASGVMIFRNWSCIFCGR
ncbi:MAG: sigma-54-dependent Fis family transcriptional regulator [Ignavibacteria bacterium]|nr:sigma-54-dependent Fis family transcriptional regulator [Ignavibacteria bacterium]